MSEPFFDMFNVWRRDYTQEEINRYDRFSDWVCLHGQGIMTLKEYSGIASPQAGWSVAQRLPHLFAYWVAMTALNQDLLRPEEFLTSYKEQEDV